MLKVLLITDLTGMMEPRLEPFDSPVGPHINTPCLINGHLLHFYFDNHSTIPEQPEACPSSSH